MIIKCVIAGTNANGAPDLTFIKVDCSELQYTDGYHYETAKQWASEDQGYKGPFVAFDENDGPDALFGLFIWDSASTVEA